MMDSKLLMIGDWCKMKLSFGATWFTDKVGCINPDNEMEYEPIPLTTEILEKNGWKFIFPESEYRSPEDIAFKESLRLQNGADGNAFWWIVGYALICPINYVHELQHALRLCGLNELADNFKI